MEKRMTKQCIQCGTLIIENGLVIKDSNFWRNTFICEKCYQRNLQQERNKKRLKFQTFMKEMRKKELKKRVRTF